jgi:phospholipid/cholesterol/gamma-HCH transport system ATP-binding protein
VPTEPPIIELQGVSKTFGTRRLLESIDLTIHKGESLVILGGSGSGKSTTLRVITGAVTPDAGDVRVLGRSVHSLPRAERDTFKRSIGMLFQSAALFNSMSVYDNVALPLREHTTLEESTIEVVVKIKLEQVGLREHSNKMPSELSGGMKKRAGLARAMALDPPILLCDEPSAGLDPVTSAEIDQLILDLNDRLGVTVVTVTHEMDSAFRIADRMALLDRGRFVAFGSPQQMRDSTDPLVRQFVHGLTEGPLTDRRRDSNYESDLLGGKR